MLDAELDAAAFREISSGFREIGAGSAPRRTACRRPWPSRRTCTATRTTSFSAVGSASSPRLLPLPKTTRHSLKIKRGSALRKTNCSLHRDTLDGAASWTASLTAGWTAAELSATASIGPSCLFDYAPDEIAAVQHLAPLAGDVPRTNPSRPCFEARLERQEEEEMSRLHLF